MLIPSPSGPLRIPDRVKPCDITLSLVLPTLNEAENIEAVIAASSSVLEKAGISYELIVVDDDSPDETWRKAVSCAASLSTLRVIRRTGEKGLATAIVRGWQAARGETLGVMDADLQHPPEALPKLWAEIDGGADLAVASRYAPAGGISDWSLRRRIVSRVAQGIGLLVLPEIAGRLRDPMSGYLLVRREKLVGVTLKPRGYKILLEVLGRCDIRSIAEVGYVFRERSQSQSKLTWRIYRDYLLHLGSLRVRHFQ